MNQRADGPGLESAADGPGSQNGPSAVADAPGSALGVGVCVALGAVVFFFDFGLVMVGSLGLLASN